MSWTSTMPRALANATSRSKKSRPTTAVVGLWGNETTITLGGGYSLPLELTAEAHANVYRTAWEIFD